MNIVILDEAETKVLFDGLGLKQDTMYRFRVSTDGGMLRVKVNEGCWSPPLGRLADEGGY